MLLPFGEAWRVNYEPDGTGGGAPAAPAVAPDPVASATPTTSTPADPGGGAAPTTSTSDQWTGVRDALKGYGIDLTGTFQDDSQALAHLAQTYLQARQIMPQYQQVAPHLAEFQKWRQEQQAAQEKTKQQSWWKAPEWDPSWAGLIERDPVTGGLRVKDGHAPDILPKYQQAQAHATDFLRKFAFDPVGSIRPGIEEIVKEVAAKLVQENLGQFQGQSFAQQLIRENRSWMFASQDGNPVIDPLTQQAQLSPAGKAYASYVQQAQDLGVQDLQAQHTYAMRLLGADLARSPQQQNDALKNAFVRNGAQPPAPGVNPGAATPPSRTIPAQPGGRDGLAKRLKANLEQAGFVAGQKI